MSSYLAYLFLFLCDKYSHDTILGMSKFKASADDEFGVAEIIEFVFERVENIVGKGENAGYQHFLLFLPCFQRTSYPGSLKPGLCAEDDITFQPKGKIK